MLNGPSLLLLFFILYFMCVSYCDMSKCFPENTHTLESFVHISSCLEEEVYQPWRFSDGTTALLFHLSKCLCSVLSAVIYPTVTHLPDVSSLSFINSQLVVFPYLISIVVDAHIDHNVTCNCLCSVLRAVIYQAVTHLPDVSSLLL